MSAEPLARTVLGDLPVDRLGVTDSHDHLMFASPLLPGEELADVTAARAELERFRAAGGNTVVQWTPAGLGRGLPDVAALSRATGIAVIAATGRHRAVHYPDGAAAESLEQLTDRFVADLSATALPCGIIKVGTGFHHLDGFERLSLEAAAAAALRTGAPIAVHLELGTGADLVLGQLTAAGGDPSRVILGHLGRNPDRGYHREVAASGAFLCFDGPSRANHQTDWRTVDSLVELAGDGHLGQLLIGGDTTTAGARSVGQGPGLPGLLTGLTERIRRSLGVEAAEAITIANPARAFALAAVDQNSSRSIPRSRVGAEWVSAPIER